MECTVNSSGGEADKQRHESWQELGAHQILSGDRTWHWNEGLKVRRNTPTALWTEWQTLLYMFHLAREWLLRVMRTCDWMHSCKRDNCCRGGGQRLHQWECVCHILHLTDSGKSPLPHLQIDSLECWNASKRKVSLPSWLFTAIHGGC